MTQNGLSLKSYIAAFGILIVGSFADAALHCAETAQVAAKRIQAWNARR